MATPMPNEHLAEATSENIAPNKYERIFQHISNSRFADTQIAIESYLRSLNLPRPKYTAELIIFMERSFKGKYLRGERSHYQRIMPSTKWRQGDTLAEKLTRCRDKETFKRRFDLIGTTEILREAHFKNAQISDENLNFKDKLYLRLMDTVRDNRSIFFRDDKAVDAFIKKALLHHEALRKAPKQLTGSGSAKKPALVHLKKPEVVGHENPKPLQYTEKDSEKNTKKNNGNSLALVHSFSFEKNQKQTTEGNYDLVKKVTPITSKQVTGTNTFKLWRNSILEKHPENCISSEPTKAQIDKATELSKRFSEFFPANQMSVFLQEVSDCWISLSKYLKAEGVWQNLGSYPELSKLVTHCDHILTWYRNRLPKQIEEPQKTTPTQEIITAHSTKPPVPFIGCNRINAPGITFHKNFPESLEYEIAMALKNKFPQHLVLFFIDKIKEIGVDFATSEKRIAELQKMTEYEVEQYCC